MEHKQGNEAYIILHRGARSRGYKRRERARARARARESPYVLPVSSAPRPYVPPMSTCVNVSQRLSTCSERVNLNVPRSERVNLNVP
jgi:hypothetical protein